MTFFLIKGPGWERLGDLDNRQERCQESLFNFSLFKIAAVYNVSRCDQTLPECTAQRHRCCCCCFCSHLKVNFSAQERSIRFRIIVPSSRMSASWRAPVCIWTHFSLFSRYFSAVVNSLTSQLSATSSLSFSWQSPKFNSHCFTAETTTSVFNGSTVSEMIWSAWEWYRL